MCWRFRTTRAAGAGGSQRLGASGDLYSASLARSPRALSARTAAPALGRSARWRLLPWARPLCGRPPPPSHAPHHRPHPASRMGQRRGSARREGQAELLGLEEDSRCGAQPPVCIHRAARRAREAAAGPTREGEGGRVSPGEGSPPGSNRPARCARAIRSAVVAARNPHGVPDSAGPGLEGRHCASPPWPFSQGGAQTVSGCLRHARCATPPRAELTATACPGCRPRARGGGPAPAALPRTELTGRGLRATGLGPAGCAALGS